MPTNASPLRELVAEPSRLTPQRLWQKLEPSDRQEAAASLLARPHSDRSRLVVPLAESRKFRVQTVAGWPDAKLSRAFGLVTLDDRELILDLLHAMHVPGRCEVLASFLDTLNVSHDGGCVGEGVLESLDPAPDLMAAAAETVIDEHGEHQVLTYFATLILQGVPLASTLADWLQQYTHGLGHVRADEEVQLEPEEFDDLYEPHIAVGLTTLDKQAIFSIVDAAQGVDGALDEDEIDDLVDQLLHLNGRRHQSYFHAGLRDVLFERSPSSETREENVSRARWYWAGVVQGYARNRRWSDIVEAYDRIDVVRTLGNGEDGASEAAVKHIAMALRELGRGAEISTFVSARALVRWPQLLAVLLDHGTTLLRTNRAPEAKGIFSLLMVTVSQLADSDGLADWPLFLEIKRRYAHCLREVRELKRAESLLTELLNEDPNPAVKAMALADLGLIDGGFRRLSDVNLPESRDDLATVADALGAGEARFREAVAIESRYSSHGHYCLGVLALADEDFDSAEHHLQIARAAFRANPRRYESGELPPRADVYTGIALAHSLQPGRMSHAARLIQSGLEKGVPIPGYLVRTTVEHLALGTSSDLEAVVEAMLTQASDQYVSVLGTVDIQQPLRGLAEALLRRANEPERSLLGQAANLRAALRHFAGLQRMDDLAFCLDRLEDLALEGIASEDFLELLEDPQYYGLVWNSEDALVARARVHEAKGETVQSAATLAEIFHRALARRERDAKDEARGVLEAIRALAVEEDFIEPLAKRFAAFEEHAASEDCGDPAAQCPPVRVLMVGGDERQEKRDGALVRELKRRAPHIEVSFLRTGWTSNWNRHIEEFERRQPGVDAVVLMRFMRTEFGRKVRQKCEVPWRFCWGAGRESSIRALRAAAEAANEIQAT